MGIDSMIDGNIDIFPNKVCNFATWETQRIIDKLSLSTLQYF